MSSSATYAPATLTASASGGSGTRQIRLAGGTWYTNSATYSNRSAGYYGFQARAYTYASDGYNDDTNWSGTDTCGITLTDPPFSPSGWGSTAPGCPSLGIYITPGDPITWAVRRATVTGCQLRWTVTEAGETWDRPVGTVVGTGSYTIGSGASSYARTSGSSGVMGPLYWP